MDKLFDSLPPGMRSTHASRSTSPRRSGREELRDSRVLLSTTPWGSSRPPRLAIVPSGPVVERPVVRSSPGHDECGIDALEATLSNSARQAQLRTMLTSVARRRYGIGLNDAGDVFQDSVLTYLLSRKRFPTGSNHYGVLVGIFHRKALTSLTTSRRRARGLARLAVRLANGRGAADPQAAPDAAMIGAERNAAIRAAVDALGHDARQTLLCLADGRQRRLDLIAQLGMNPNTFDSRLHVARERLRLDLARRGGY